MTASLTLHADAGETIEGVGQALRARRTTCAAVLERCVHQIDLWDDRVHAWVYLDRSGAMRQARELDAELARGECRGPLHGIPFGIKDLIDVAGMPTAAGFGPWRERVAEADAPLVAALRAAGAVVLGKTVTTQFAWVDPPVTVNPWHPERTPGGSSSGSAAAVATGMCLGAIGTQTGGSLIRPAAFCGTAGVKPGYGELPSEGIVPLAPSLDHPGVFARTCRDLALVMGELTADGGAGAPSTVEAVEAQLSGAFFQADEPLRLGRLRGFHDRRADPMVREAMDRTVEALTAAGAQVVDVDEEAVGLDFDDLLWQHRVILAAEAASDHEKRLNERRGDYAPRVRDLVEEGLKLPVTAYVKAHRRWEACQSARSGGKECPGAPEWVRLTLDAFLTPAALGPAPDRGSTGDAAFNSAWSFLGLPVATFPVGRSPDGLPIGVQLVCHPNAYQADFLDRAGWCEEAVRRAGREG